MVKPTSLWMAFLMFASAPALASVQDYSLTPTDQFDQHCQSKDDGPQSSKLKIQLVDQGSSQSSVLMTVKLCTRRFGFRRLTVEETIPAMLLNEAALGTMKVGETRSLSAGGRGMTLSRKSDTASFMVFQLQGLDQKVSTIQISIPLQKGWQDDVPGGSRISLPWFRIQFQYRHPLAGTFQLSGKLDEVQRD